MRCRSACLLGLAGTAVLSSALSLEKRDQPAVIALPFVRDQDSLSKIMKRSKTAGVSSAFGDVDFRSKVAPAVRI
ncbi:Peptidase aspartic catalytic [Penicillium cosmopolitanum]|uniref:Peptidase aspartic catalytic n=1 Tax=Penicillium cosmopolitanum TaxID=1131564 RepID=A0A9X0BB96_9EURO|nr:Peptidase aspartic catalytic [Penicillium cosmopolitanum]KAJ5403363.1 Peptidase aspartic catalytic [Penicillium cosmopolitanum]